MAYQAMSKHLKNQQYSTFEVRNKPHLGNINEHFFTTMAKDKYHEQVRLALEKDGWTITDDPYQLLMGNRRTYIDLGAERLLIGAEKGKEKIAVEIKTFMGARIYKTLIKLLGNFCVTVRRSKKKSPIENYTLPCPLFFTIVFSKICSSWNF